MGATRVSVDDALQPRRREALSCTLLSWLDAVARPCMMVLVVVRHAAEEPVLVVDAAAETSARLEMSARLRIEVELANNSCTVAQFLEHCRQERESRPSAVQPKADAMPTSQPCRPVMNAAREGAHLRTPAEINRSPVRVRQQDEQGKALWV